MFFVWTSWLYLLPFFSISYSFLPFTLRMVFKALTVFIICSLFITGYVGPKNEIVIDQYKITRKYLTTYFVFDLTSLVTVTLYEVYTISLSKTQYLENFKWIFYVFCCALFSLCVRIRTVLNILSRTLSARRCNKWLTFVIINSFKVIYLLHASTCLFYLIPMAIYSGNFPEKSWFYIMNIHQPKTLYDYLDLYTRCLTVCVCTFLGAKDNTYKPTLPYELLSIAVVGFVGRLYTLFFIGKALRVCSSIGISESKYDQCMLQLNEYANSKKLPQDLKDKLIEFYDNKLQKRFFNENQIMRHLSDTLRTEMFLFNAKSLISKTPLLSKLPNNVLGILFTLMSSETYLGGQVIAKPGDQIRYIHFIASGTIVIYTKDNLELAHLKDGNDFGFLSEWVAKKCFHKYLFVAIETSQMYQIPVKVFADFFRVKSDILVYFEKKTKARSEYLIKLETFLQSGEKGESIIAHLRSGLVLEPRIHKTFAFE